MIADQLRAYFLVGPTAVGKSAVAQLIAEDGAFDIVSADSMLVYRTMNIGTAKPTVAEQSRVKHWCMDLAEPGALFSAGLYRTAALAALTSIASGGRSAVVVGGTGLYVKALTHGIQQTPSPDPGLRAELDIIARDRPIAELQEMLERMAPDLFTSLSDKFNPRRLVRAIELAHAGIREPPASWKKKDKGPMLTGLRFDLAQLRDRIDIRAREMFQKGLIDEVKILLSAGFGGSQAAQSAIGYVEAISVVNGSCTVDEAVQRTAQRTFQLARRQMTWFRHQSNVDWIDIDIGMDAATIAESVKESWRKHGPAPIAG